MCETTRFYFGNNLIIISEVWNTNTSKKRSKILKNSLLLQSIQMAKNVQQYNVFSNTKMFFSSYTRLSNWPESYFEKHELDCREMSANRLKSAKYV